MKALVLAGGYPQISLIEELKSRGIFVILADYYETPVARKYADKFYRISTLDTESIERVARNEKVDFLITAFTDQALLTVALVSERLELPCYLDYKTALNVTNKEFMKQIFLENGIPTAKFCIVEEFDFEVLESMHYPLIIKPVDCNSSKGVRKVCNESDLEDAIRVASRLSRTKTAIVEEYVDGEEISVDAYIEDGVSHILAVSSSVKIVDLEKFIIFRSDYPAERLDSIEMAIRKSVQLIADSFNLKNTPMLVQFIRKDNELFVLEFSARTGGGTKYSMIKSASGFDVTKALVNLTLGLKPHVSIIVPENNYISDVYIYCMPGVFDHFVGFEELKTAGVIADYFVFKWKGAVIDKIESSGDRIGGFTIQADTREEMIQKYNETSSRIKVMDQDGKDIMRHDLLTPLFE